jgi:hypothetical protein
MLHVKQLPLQLGAKYAEHPPCGGQLHLQEVCTNIYLDRRSLCAAVTCSILYGVQLRLDCK